jgi:hypothetical protein
MPKSRKEYQQRGNYHVFYVNNGVNKTIPPQQSHLDMFSNDEHFVKSQKDKLTLDTETLSNSSPNTRLAISNRKYGIERIPRPQNPFMIYRRDEKARLRQMPEYKGAKEAELSVIIGKKWKNESEEIKNLYKSLAKKI